MSEPKASKRKASARSPRGAPVEAVAVLEDFIVFEGRFVCVRCTYKVDVWQSHCPGCKKINTLISAAETTELSSDMVQKLEYVKDPRTGKIVLDDEGQPVMAPPSDEDDEDEDDEDSTPKLYCVAEAKIRQFERMSLGIEGFDHLCCEPDLWKGKKAAGPIVGHVIGMTGRPGSGKSTLALEAAVNVSASGGCAVILDGEERKEATYVNAFKVAKAKKLNTSSKNGDLLGLHVTDETDVIEDALEMALEMSPNLVMINSLQEFRSGELDDRGEHVFDEGDPKQMKRVIRKIVNFAQGKNSMKMPILTLLVVQVKQDGSIDGVGKKILHKLDQCFEFTRLPEYDVKGSTDYKVIMCKAMEGKARGADDTVHSKFKRISKGVSSGCLKPLGVFT
jgi:predicted ATP-dependent serine protease